MTTPPPVPNVPPFDPSNAPAGGFAPPPVPPAAVQVPASQFSPNALPPAFTREYVPRGGAAAPPPMAARPGAGAEGGFPVPWWALLAMAPMALIQLLAAMLRPSISGTTATGGASLAYVIGSILWPTLIAGFLTFVVWLLAGKSSKAAGVTLLVVYGLSTVSGALKLANGPKTAMADGPSYTYITDSSSGSDTPSGPMTVTGGSGPRVVEQGGIHIVAKPGAAKPAPKPVEPPKPVAPRILSVPEATRKATDAVKAAQSKTTPATQRWSALGGFDMGAVKSEADLAERIEAADAVAAVMREARDSVDGAREELKKDLAAARVPVSQRTNNVAMWAAELEDDRQVALAVEKYMAEGRQQLVFLQQHWGRWHVDQQSGRVVMKDKKAAQQFTRGAEEVEAARKQLVRALNKAKDSLLARGMVR